MTKAVARVEVDTQAAPPEMPGGVEKTEKLDAATKTEDEANAAQFWSRYKEFRLGLDPQISQVVNGRWVDLPNSGDAIQFHNYTAIVKGEKRIRRCLRHKRFGIDFDIDTRDETGYWKRKGFLRVEKIEKVTVARTDKVDIEEG
jgi:hypothetical protein